MNIKSNMPKDFYKLFSSKYLDYYQLAVVALYDESSQSYSVLGLTEEECQEVIREKMTTFTLDWSQEQMEDEGELLTRANMPSMMLRRLEGWGWLRKDYDETLNQYVVSFPNYSQMFAEVFQRLQREDDGMERSSILAVYSHLFTYYSDSEKNNEILKSALCTSKALQQMLANMQEGIRGYFEELSRRKTFIGIQEVLVDEINNSDSRKYAILTTTDSFYRYKEEVKELIDKNLSENEMHKQAFIAKSATLEEGSVAWRRNQKAIEICQEAMELLFQINREFDGIERRYQKLIDQKRVFAKRAAARIRYILAEGDEEDRTKALVRLLDNSKNRAEILESLGQNLGLTQRFHVIKEKSFARPRNAVKREFEPQAVEIQKEEQEFDDFVVKPLYTQAEIESFRKKNEQDGVFWVTQDTVHTVQDLEKLLFVWQEATEISDLDVAAETGETFVTKEGFRYSAFSIRRNGDG